MRRLHTIGLGSRDKTQLLAAIRTKVFPDHWSVRLGQASVLSFVVVAISGVVLTFFYDPSMQRVTYSGSYEPLVGVEMSRAFASTLDISFEIRGGLLLRQMHAWSSLVMAAAIVLHLLWLFFTGGFRKPRQPVWFVVTTLLLAAMAAVLTGTALPDDLLSGTSMAVLDGLLVATPVVGTWLSNLVFGGSFPGGAIAVFYPLHVVVLPVVLVIGFIALAILGLRHGPARHPWRGVSDPAAKQPLVQVVATPAVRSADEQVTAQAVAAPVRRADELSTARATVAAVRASLANGLGLFLLVSGVIVLMAATLTINPIWEYGPADPASAASGSTPAWPMAFLDGALRLAPGWEFEWLSRTWSVAILAPMLVCALFFALVAVYPYVERWVTGDTNDHHLLERPRNNPTRTGIGVAGIIFYGVLWAAAGSNVIAYAFSTSVEVLMYALQVLLVLGPVAGFEITRRICIGLQRRDREIALHGYETGQIVRTPTGGYVEAHAPVSANGRRRLAAYEDHRPVPLQRDVHGQTTVPQRLQVHLSHLFYRDRILPLAREELGQDARHVVSAMGTMPAQPVWRPDGQSADSTEAPGDVA
ncbi:MAG TPA: cytochrome b N-terminal domain-containing protein [Actinopolymorphaceae bacterium]